MTALKEQARPSFPCEWCGLAAYDPLASVLAQWPYCLCMGCIDCGFVHDVGPPRTGRVVRVARGPDGLIHEIQWERGVYSIPSCWNGANHLDPYPRDFEFETVDVAINCLECLGAS